MLVTHCFLHVTCTIWVQITEMSDSLGRRNSKRKTVATCIFRLVSWVSDDHNWLIKIFISVQIFTRPQWGPEICMTWCLLIIGSYYKPQCRQLVNLSTRRVVYCSMQIPLMESEWESKQQLLVREIFFLQCGWQSSTELLTVQFQVSGVCPVMSDSFLYSCDDIAMMSELQHWC